MSALGALAGGSPALPAGPSVWHRCGPPQRSFAQSINQLDSNPLGNLQKTDSQALTQASGSGTQESRFFTCSEADSDIQPSLELLTCGAERILWGQADTSLNSGSVSISFVILGKQLTLSEVRLLTHL